jgi:hypothetical protein
MDAAAAGDDDADIDIELKDLRCDERETKAIVDGSINDAQKAHIADRFRLFLIDMLRE